MKESIFLFIGAPNRLITGWVTIWLIVNCPKFYKASDNFIFINLLPHKVHEAKVFLAHCQKIWIWINYLIHFEFWSYFERFFIFCNIPMLQTFINGISFIHLFNLKQLDESFIKNWVRKTPIHSTRGTRPNADSCNNN